VKVVAGLVGGGLVASRGCSGGTLVAQIAPERGAGQPDGVERKEDGFGCLTFYLA